MRIIANGPKIQVFFVYGKTDVDTMRSSLADIRNLSGKITICKVNRPASARYRKSTCSAYDVAYMFIAERYLLVNSDLFSW